MAIVGVASYQQYVGMAIVGVAISGAWLAIVGVAIVIVGVTIVQLTVIVCDLDANRRTSNGDTSDRSSSQCECFIWLISIIIDNVQSHTFHQVTKYEGNGARIGSGIIIGRGYSSNGTCRKIR